MKALLKLIRKNKTINRLIRNVLCNMTYFIRYISSRWLLSGIIPLEVNNISFQMFSSCDDGIIEPLFYKKDYVEYNDLRVFLSLICPSDLIMDIGANTGIYTILSAMKCTNGKVYCFEPNPVNLQRLKLNISINKLKNTFISESAVGSQSGTTTLSVHANGSISDTSSVLSSFSKSSYGGKIAWQEITTNQLSIDDFVTSEELPQIHAIKIDVEGYEIEVLKGMTKTIQRYKPILLVESFIDKTKSAYLENFVQNNGYEVYLIMSDGIVRVEKQFNRKTGLNFLLLPFITPDIYTPLANLNSLRAQML